MRRVTLIGAAAMAVASSATAQRHTETDTGSLIRVPQRARIPDAGNAADRSRIALSEFARCTVDRRAVPLARLLRAAPSEVDGSGWATLASDDCLAAGEMRFKAIVLRGAVFSELYRRRQTGSAIWSRLPVAAAYDPATAVPAGDGDKAVQMGLLAFAYCVVRQDRADASAMVAAPTASKVQLAALSTLRPALATCLPQGQQIKLSKPILEGSIAEILYRDPATATVLEAR